VDVAQLFIENLPHSYDASPAYEIT